jgi:hypothetical protein
VSVIFITDKDTWLFVLFDSFFLLFPFFYRYTVQAVVYSRRQNGKVKIGRRRIRQSTGRGTLGADVTLV